MLCNVISLANAIIVLFFSIDAANSLATPRMSAAKQNAELLNVSSTLSNFAANCEKFKHANSLPECSYRSVRRDCRLDAGTGSRLRKFVLDVDQGPLNTTGVTDKRDFIRVNGQSPGPAIEVNVGDVLDITVNNFLTVDTVIHWHAQMQTGTTFADGVPGLTQCPIPPDSSFSYRFVAEIPGTFWYHGHIHDQYTDGLRGMLIIHRAAADDIVPRKIDATFLIAEYVSLMSPTLTKDHHCPVSVMNGGQPVIVPDTFKVVLTPGTAPVPGLMRNFTNGTSIFLAAGSIDPCGGGGATQTEVNGDANEYHPILVDYTGTMRDVTADVVSPFLSSYYLRRSSNGRLRFINGASRTSFQVFIEGYDALLTEIDGVLTTAKAFPNFHFHVAQRIVIEFDPSRVKNQTILKQGYAVFYITVSNAASGITTRNNVSCSSTPAHGVQGCLQVRTGYIVFTTKGAQKVRALITNHRNVPVLSAFDAARKLLKPNRLRGRFASDITEANNLDTIPLERSYFIEENEVTHVIELAVTFLGGLIGFNNQLYSETRQYTNPPYALKGYAQDKFGISEKTYAPWGGKSPRVDVPDINLTFATPFGAVVEIRVVGANGHPIHLHGHTFNVIAGNNTQAKRDVAVGGTSLVGEEEAPPIEPKLVFRFRNNNPGAWALHCHIDWHMDMGLFALLLEAYDKLFFSDIRIPRDNYQSCAAYPKCDSVNTCPVRDQTFEKVREIGLKSMLPVRVT